jgi:hypothetical protein
MTDSEHIEILYRLVQELTHRVEKLESDLAETNRAIIRGRFPNSDDE